MTELQLHSLSGDAPPVALGLWVDLMLFGCRGSQGRIGRWTREVGPTAWKVMLSAQLGSSVDWAQCLR